MTQINLDGDVLSVYERLSQGGTYREICLHGISKARTCLDCVRMEVQSLSRAGVAQVARAAVS